LVARDTRVFPAVRPASFKPPTGRPPGGQGLGEGPASQGGGVVKTGVHRRRDGPAAPEVSEQPARGRRALLQAQEDRCALVRARSQVELQPPRRGQGEGAGTGSGGKGQVQSLCGEAKRTGPGQDKAG
jgi:hypothetical protein